MELDLPKTVAAFAVLIAVGVGGLVGAPIPMGTDTILMMVAPSMVVFGLICLAIGVAHGQYRAGATR
ncbi:DUF7333 family protein [Halosimplex pelagicum]|uniref:Uncharacterized protein n=1 Tax=Halosimplex pelagicum TaxID=869886 RepID=A0A7D5TCL9_9EURY|nr:hypothetical protein [Halosimplex pelagicum]QLH84750.1 hypothetical protein HZS54_25260 [Halosimplex pelagicum]